MGLGGYLMLINITPFNWTMGDPGSYQMNKWDFPPTLAPYSLTQVYIESEDWVGVPADTQAGVTFSTSIGSDTLSYRVEYIYGTADVRFIGMHTTETAQGGQINLNYKATESTSQTPVNANPFILSSFSDDPTTGTPSFSSNDGATAWMTQDLPILGCRPLRHICLPGSHDAGMSKAEGGTFLSSPDSVVTQSNDILGQLMSGSRYFDIRPVISDGQYKTGHYSQIGITYQGANGQSIAEIIQQVNKFTDQYQELVILDLSHSLNTDLGAESYRKFTQEEWDGLLDQLQGGLNHLSSTPSQWPDTDIGWIRLDSFIGTGTAAVIVSVPGDVDLGPREGHGFVNSARQMNLINDYADTDDPEKMRDDQFRKLRQNRTDPDGPGFLMSWTLTQDTADGLFGPSVLDLAFKANNALYGDNYFWDNWVGSPLVFPNVLLIDDVPGDGRFRALVVGMNRMIGSWYYPCA